jgi:hypothetical protein
LGEAGVDLKIPSSARSPVEPALWRFFPFGEEYANAIDNPLISRH